MLQLKLKRVCADHDAEAECPQACSVYKNLYIARRVLLRGMHGCSYVVRAVGKKVLGPFSRFAKWRIVPLKCTDLEAGDDTRDKIPKM